MEPDNTRPATCASASTDIMLLITRPSISIGVMPCIRVCAEITTRATQNPIKTVVSTVVGTVARMASRTIPPRNAEQTRHHHVFLRCCLAEACHQQGSQHHTDTDQRAEAGEHGLLRMQAVAHVDGNQSTVTAHGEHARRHGQNREQKRSVGHDEAGTRAEFAENGRESFGIQPGFALQGNGRNYRRGEDERHRVQPETCSLTRFADERCGEKEAEK